MKQRTTTEVLKTRRYLSLVICLILKLLFQSPVFGQSAVTTYRYDVTLDQQYCTKAILEQATADLDVFNRSLLENGITFSAFTGYNEQYIIAYLAERNIPVNGIEIVKGSMVLPVAGKLGGNDCESAQQLCSGTTLSGGATGFGNQELSGTNRGCLSGNERQSSWYYMNIQTGGSLTFTIDPAVNSDDYDFAVWGPFTAATAGANCPPISQPIRCSWYNNGNGLGNTGCFGTSATPQGVSEDATLDYNTPFIYIADGYVQQINALANEVYILLVDNYTISLNPYDLSFGGTAVIGCTPVVLPVELSDFSGLATTEGNLVSWVTQSEHASVNFRVEWTDRPQAGIWESIGVQKAAGNSDKAVSYHMLDQHKRKGINYYRLVQTDNNGTEHVFNDRIIVIDNSKEEIQSVRILNLLGQEIDKNAKGLLLLQFENGYTFKVFRE